MSESPEEPPQRSAEVDLLLAALLGWVSADRIYLGLHPTAFVKLALPAVSGLALALLLTGSVPAAAALALGGLPLIGWIGWTLVDVALAATGRMRDARWRPLEGADALGGLRWLAAVPVLLLIGAVLALATHPLVVRELVDAGSRPTQVRPLPEAARPGPDGRHRFDRAVAEQQVRVLLGARGFATGQPQCRDPGPVAPPSDDVAFPCVASDVYEGTIAVPPLEVVALWRFADGTVQISTVEPAQPGDLPAP